MDARGGEAHGSVLVEPGDVVIGAIGDEPVEAIAEGVDEVAGGAGGASGIGEGGVGRAVADLKGDGDGGVATDTAGGIVVSS